MTLKLHRACLQEFCLLKFILVPSLQVLLKVSVCCPLHTYHAVAQGKSLLGPLKLKCWTSSSVKETKPSLTPGRQPRSHHSIER